MLKKENIISLTKQDILRAGEVLGSALKDDPVSVYVIPNKEKRYESIKHVFQFTTCIGLRYGEVHATSTNLEGVGVWMPFETYKEKSWGNFLCSFKAKMWKLGTKAGKLFKPIMEINSKMHLKYAPGKHWYLQSLGVDPEFQRKGYGTLLMNYILEKIDKDPLPVFLETSTVNNVNFYKKLGFEVMEEAIAEGTEVNQFFMLRPKI